MKKSLYLLSLLILAASAVCRAQAPHLQWQKVMGNENGDYLKKVLQTSDGGYVVAGYREGNIVPVSSNSAYIDNVIIVSKFDAAGEVQWENAVISGAQMMADLVQTPDGGYLIITSAWIEECNVPSHPDVYAIRLNAKGEIIWKKHYGGLNTDDGYAVDITPDGDYVIAGSTRSSDLAGYHGNNDWWIIKIDDAGNLLWQKTLGGSADEFAFSVAVAADGSSLVGGYTDSNDGDVSGRKGPRDAWVVKLSPNGTVLWKKCFGGSMYEMCNSITRSHSGGFVLAIQANSSDGDVSGVHNTLGAFSDYWIVDISASGNINWSRCFGGLYNETPYDIQPTRDGGYVVAGSAESANGDLTCNKGSEDIWLIKVSGNGSLQWQKSFGGALYDQAFSVQQLADNSFILAGQTCSKQIAGYHQVLQGAYASCGDYLLLKLSKEGVATPPLTVTIDEKTAKVCQGASATLHASSLHGGITSEYQWTKNGVAVGDNSPYYTTSNLQANDRVRCTVVSDGSCESSGTTAYDEVQISWKPAVPLPEILIKSSTDVLCGCNAVSFRATVKNKGEKPQYTWKVNGKSKWSNQDVLIVDKLNPGDVVVCEYADATSCLPGGKISSNTIQFLAGGSGAASVAISTASATICEGSAVRVDAAATNAGIGAIYQWTINGQVVGTNADSLIIGTPKNGDRVQCTVTVDPAFTCASNSVVTSSEIMLSVKSKLTPAVSLAPVSNSLCKGDEVTLSVQSHNTGMAPKYQWMINGAPTQETSATFKNTNVSNNDEIYCVVTPGEDVCDATPIFSDTVRFIVHDVPRVQIIPADTIVKRNAVVQLRTSITGSYSSVAWEPSQLFVDNESLHPVTMPLRESIQIKFTVINERGCTVTATSKISIRSALFMPNAFTPNRDGHNDVFRIPEGTTLDLLEFSVYDRWGNKVFTTKDITQVWTGNNAAGKPLDNGSYVYVVRGTDEKGSVMQKGTVLMIR